MKTFAKITEDIYSCHRCNLYLGKREYVPGILGSKQPKIVIIGEAPGAMEDMTGEPFKGRSGTILNTCMEEYLGLKRGDYSILNTVKCRPPENRDPTDHEKRACKPWLMEQLAAIRPATIITMGTHAAHSILGERLPMRELREYYYALDNHRCDVFPTYHPMATAYVQARRMDFIQDLKLLLNKKYKEVRRRGRCSLSFDAPQDLDCGGIAL